MQREKAYRKRLRHGRAIVSLRDIDPNHVRFASQYASVTRPIVLDFIERYAPDKTLLVIPAPEAVDAFASALRRSAV